MIKILNTYGNTGYELMHGDYDVLAKLQDNCTNGDMIKALFPNACITDHFEGNAPIGDIIYIRLDKYQEMRVQEDWWNAPYERG